MCMHDFSYRTSITNLKMHLKIKHLSAYKTLSKPPPNRRRNKYDVGDHSESEEEASVLDPEHELWGFYDKEPHNRAKCSMCGARLQRDPELLYNHLKERHSKISENLEYKDNDDSYTEVIYLEDPIESPNVDEKPRIDPKVLTEVQPKAKKPVKRRHSTIEVKSIENKSEKIIKEDNEIENFGRYITGLLKGVSKSACTQLQMDIVTLIMNAKLNIEPTAPDITTVDLELDKDPEPDDRGENQENEYEIPIVTEKQCGPQRQDTDTSKSDTPHSKRPRRRISYREEYTYNVNLTDKEEIEVENFGKYVTCLLKTVPHRDTGSKLQMQIVNLIMSARMKLLKSNAPTLTVNGTIELRNKEDYNQETTDVE